MKINWSGVYPAVTTKFTHTGELDIPNFLKNIDAQVNAGIDGIIVGGSLGESSTITHEERLELLDATKATFKHLPVLINVAEGSTKNAIVLAQAAQERNADGIMLLPPMMYKPTDQETTQFFLDVANETDLPILLYNNPVDYKVEIKLPMLSELLKNDKIEAIKESTRDISNVTRMKNEFGDRLKILCGVDTLAMEELVMGADGWVAGLVDAFPAETVAIFRLVKVGRIEEALRIYRWFLPILELDISPQLVQNIKLAEVMTGIGTENVRAPRKMLRGAERARVISIIQKGLDNRPDLCNYKSIKL